MSVFNRDLERIAFGKRLEAAAVIILTHGGGFAFEYPVVDHGGLVDSRKGLHNGPGRWSDGNEKRSD